MKGRSADSKRVLQALIRACAKAVNRNGVAFYAELSHLIVHSVAVFWQARSESPNLLLDTEYVYKTLFSTDA